MKRYQVLPHTVDLRFKAYGMDLEAIFKNSNLGLAKILYKDIDKKQKFIRGVEKISLEADDENSLLVDFLNEVLTLSNINKKVYPKTKILRLSPKRIEAQVSGVGVDGFDEDIKAVSYHGAEIKEAKKGSEVELTLDI